MIDDHYDRQLETVMTNVVDDAVEIYEPLNAKISAILNSSNDFDTAQQSIAQLDTKEFQEAFSIHILNALELGNALGRSIITKKDESLSGENSVAAKDESLEWFVCADGPVSISFNIIPKAALEYLQQKSLQLAGVESEAVKAAVKAKIEEAIKSGQTVSDFRKEIDSMFDSLGITKLSKQHIDLVYRMNTFAAYSIGQANQVADMIDRFPLAYFSPIHDSRSRHIPLEGYYPSDIVPLSPIDYNCRCGIRYVHVSQITGNEVPFYSAVPRPDLVKFDQRNS